MALLKKTIIRQHICRLDENSLKRLQCIRTVVKLSYKIIETIQAAPDSMPLFILHDLLSSRKQWDSVGKTIHTLTKRPVVTIDLRNHGKSPHTSSNTYEDMANDVQGLLKKLSIDKAYFLGHGIGGKTTMTTALLEPNKVAGMMIIDVSPTSCSKQFLDFYSNILTSMNKITFTSETTLEEAKSKAMYKLKAAILDDVTMDIVLSNIILKSDHTIGWACNVDAFIKYLKHMGSFPKNLKSKVYYGPTLFIGGQLSENLPPDDLLSIRAIFPSAVITYLPRTGHNLNVDDPRSFLELVIPLLK